MENIGAKLWGWFKTPLYIIGVIIVVKLLSGILGIVVRVVDNPSPSREELLARDRVEEQKGCENFGRLVTIYIRDAANGMTMEENLGQMHEQHLSPERVDVVTRAMQVGYANSSADPETFGREQAAQCSSKIPG